MKIASITDIRFLECICIASIIINIEYIITSPPLMIEEYNASVAKEFIISSIEAVPSSSEGDSTKKGIRKKDAIINITNIKLR